MGGEIKKADPSKFEVNIRVRYYIRMECPYCGSYETLNDADSYGSTSMRCSDCEEDFLVEWGYETDELF